MTRQEKARSDFWKGAYLEAIGPAMAENWKTDGVQQSTVEQRCAIAAMIADESLKLAEERGFA